MESHDDATNDENLSGPEGSNNDFKDDVLESRANQNPKPLISERKLAANRLNAQRSTGPKTAEGKQRSAQNSFKSGIFVRQLFLNTDSGRKEWEAYEGVAAATIVEDGGKVAVNVTVRLSADIEGRTSILTSTTSPWVSWKKCS